MEDHFDLVFTEVGGWSMNGKVSMRISDENMGNFYVIKDVRVSGIPFLLNV